MEGLPSPGKYLFNLFLYIILPCSTIFTAIYLYLQLTKVEGLKLFVCKDIFIGDGYCQDAYNLAACQFDKGDCCLSDPASKQFCKYCSCFYSINYDLADEESTAGWEFTVNLDCANSEFVGDGFCDDVTNNYMCGYDGGDCCSNFIFIVFCSSCMCHIEKDKFQSVETCSPVGKIGNLVCDDEANLKTCNYDGGDCCLSYVNRDFCQICICHEDLKQHPSILCPEKDNIGNQLCDLANNISSCNFDGGDCVDMAPNRHPVVHTTTNKYTFTETEVAPLGLFQSLCKDTFSVGNGNCQDEININVCDYDGGDCCLPFGFSNFCSFCICHETQSSLNSVGFAFNCNIASTKYMNGVCEDEQNTVFCNFDGGDCCNETHSIYTKCDKCLCHTNYPDCWFFAWIKDGVCDDLANDDICGFDGGDCCLETIDSTFCKDCVCHEDGLKHPAFAIPPCRSQHLVGNGKCEDDANTESCNYDDGDCCKELIRDLDCKQCLCHEDLTRHIGISDLSESCSILSVMNDVCNDHNNRAECAFDGGDCCLPTIFTHMCNVCICKADNTRHPSN